jgi:ubiquinone/menaquinone biosynthesis C-methylase UbiE
MKFYDRVFAEFYDRMLAAAEKAGLADRRKELVSQARGDVLEIGAGTGLNLEYYGSDLASLTLTEPSEPMADRLRERADESDLKAEVVIVGAEKLPFDDDTFDTVVSTLVLCTVDDPEASVAEIRRVLRPGGQLLFIEHVRNEDHKSAVWQDRLEKPWKAVGNGCRCNRDTAQTITDTGLAIESLDHGKFSPAPPIIQPLIQGSATAP